ncbi:acyl-CoA synthetase short-chain family member 3, mitochondrial-like isoform X2 [Lineus longissimus]|uniref:acyl-CoA synthetase short-chain family member 3, mitochondrial-like isoform X2 n=1 Tax=Lineus longissimus TaxID=88925 RepID=UPI00315D1CB8
MSTLKATVLLRNFRYPRILSGWRQKLSRPVAGCAIHTSDKDSCSIPQSHPDGEASLRQYGGAFKSARDRPEEFWGECAEGITWTRRWDKVLDASNPVFPKWFPGGELSVCYNAVDRHVDNDLGDEVAIIYDSPVTGAKRTYTYREVQYEISRLAAVLVKHGVKKGDRVLIYMPMIPQAMFAQLATARIGAIHSLVFGGFASKELSTRINHAEPKVILSASCGVEPTRKIPYKPLLDEAIRLSHHKPHKCIIYNRVGLETATLKPGLDLDYEDEMATVHPHDCVPVPAMHPLYLLYTSGTTGIPKAVVRPSGGHAVVLNWSMWNLYGLKPREVWWAASDLGWVVGHSYITYGPLLGCNPTVMFEGKPVGTPDPGTFFRVISEHNVSALFVAPTALRAIRREDPSCEYAKQFGWPKFRYLYVAGEHCDHETMDWAKAVFNTPVLDNWWQTETGSAITATCVGLGNDLFPISGVSGKPVPGWDVKVLKKDMTEARPGELGSIVVKQPLPPGSLSTLWNNDERFEHLYFENFPGYYDTMDAGTVDSNGYISVMSRADDVINVAGHRLSTGALEEAILEHNDLAECAVVGIPDKLKGHVPLGLCVIKQGVDKPHDQLIKELIQIVRDNIGPVASFKVAAIVKKIPKTRSGKIPRNTIAAMAAGQEFQIPVTIEDASVYTDIKRALSELGFNPSDPGEKPKTS